MNMKSSSSKLVSFLILTALFLFTPQAHSSDPHLTPCC